MSTQNKSFVIKNGLSVGGASGIVDVIDSTGQWIGATGTLQGASGSTGLTGATGAQGPQGASGVQGVNGASGYVGSDGATGVQGASGSAGLTGATGSQGNTGATGSQGIDGASGSNGIDGATGVQGASGATGIGATGLTGATGLQGPSGQSASYYDYKADANTYTAGPVSGRVRWNNATQTSATTIWISHTTDGTAPADIDIFLALLNNGDTIILQDIANSANYQKWQINGTPSSVTNDYWTFPVTLIGSGGSAFSNNQNMLVALVSTPVDGATGSTGPQGASGVQGASGSTGLTGATGAQGDQGASGVQGASGSTGLTGATGVQGIQGASGSTGLTGNTGAQGASGSTGLTGATGAQGPQGDQGVQGASGSTGLSGATGSTGPQGPTGVQGASGSTGINGATGATGPAGVDGASGSTGINGATGATGPAGSAGLNGATGSTGPQGNAGLNGSTGATGIIGSVLTVGSTGAIYPVLAGSTGPLSTGYLSTSFSYNPTTTVFNAPYIQATASIGASGAYGAFSYGTLNYTDGNILASFSSSVNSYNQMLLQNTSSGTAASTNFVVSNDQATNSTYYGEFGMNSSGFTQGSSLFSTPGIVYLASQSTDIAIGTYGAKSIYFTTNDNSSAYLTINATGTTTVNGPLVVSGATGVTGATGSLTVTGTTTLATGLSGLLKATSGVVSAATSGTDYAPATSGTSILYGDGSGGFSSVSIGTGLSFSSGTLTNTSSSPYITNDTASNLSYYLTMANSSSGTPTTLYTSSLSLYFNPSTGTLNATIFNSLSDKRKKKNVKKIKGALDTVLELNGVEFEWKANGMKSYGVIAQELEKVIPDLVTTDDKDNKSVNYNGLFGFLINAIKEQQAEINKLKKLIK